MIFPTIQRNKIWKCPLLPELLKLYNIQTQQENVYIHWCEINDAPDNHKFFKEDILSHIPKDVIEDLKIDKARLVFSTWQESTTSTDKYPINHQYDVDLILEKFCIENKIPTQNVFWVSGDLEIHERQKSKKIKTFGFTCYGHDILRQVTQEISDKHWKLIPINERKFEKKFICLQRWMKPGRIYWTWLMYQNDLIRHGHVSYADRIDGYGFLDKAKSFMQDVRKYQEYMATYTLDEVQLTEMWRGLASIGYDAPMTLDVKDANKNWCAGADTTLSSLPYYNNSFASVITETDVQSQGIFISEATFRPFIYQQPAIWVGSKGTVKRLQDWGFETWDWLFTEKYDYHDYMFDRLKLARTALEQICHIDFKDKKILDRVHEQNQFNWNHLCTTFLQEQKYRFTDILKGIIQR